MDYGNLLVRAWHIIVDHKYLMVLGIIAALGSGGGSGSGSGYSGSSEDFEQLFNNPDGFGASVFNNIEAWMGIAAAAIIGLICIGLIIGIVLWILSVVAGGGLVAGVNLIEEETESTFSVAWRAAWARVWSLLGISLIIVLPVMLLLLVAVGIGFLLFGVTIAGEGSFIGNAAIGGVIAFIIAMLCLIVPVGAFLALWSEFAIRACLIEEQGVIDSYRRGWRVLIDHIGPVIILALIRFGIGIALIIPVFIGSLCCLFWPILIVLNGVVTAYFSTVWTLAWREWNAMPPGTQPEALIEAA